MDRAGGKAAGGGGARLAYVDAARGLAILCLVLGHLYPGDGIVQYISSFHVPVFFILSGLLMAARDGWKTRRLTEFAAKKAKRLRAQGAEGDAAPAHCDAPWRGN